jgi:uncharacterized membrane protein YhhN
MEQVLAMGLEASTKPSRRPAAAAVFVGSDEVALMSAAVLAITSGLTPGAYRFSRELVAG